MSSHQVSRWVLGLPRQMWFAGSQGTERLPVGVSCPLLRDTRPDLNSSKTAADTNLWLIQRFAHLENSRCRRALTGVREVVFFA